MNTTHALCVLFRRRESSDLGVFAGIVVGGSGPPKMEADANKSSSFAAWSFRSLFDYKGERGKNITVQCKLCKPREKFLSTSKSSTSNLKKHLVVSRLSPSANYIRNP